MDKELERSFLETISRTLVALPFDVKVLLEAVANPDLEHDVRESPRGEVTSRLGGIVASSPTSAS